MNTTANTTVEKFTPGPWALTEPEFKKLPYKQSVFAPDCPHESDIICHAPSRYLGQPDDIWEANAKLIAAAPDMYQALKLVAQYHEHDAAWAEYGSKVMAAIKKATE